MIEERYVGLEERFLVAELRFQNRPGALEAVRRRKAMARKILDMIRKPQI